ncbi:MAG: DUF2868 domain-containing protein [Akkermansiaceae bacterium]|nr:DUF2868 domain-containing protein [Akkermansiaceae bacterium]
MATGRKAWNLEDLVDFEVAVQQSPTVEAEVGRRIREELRGVDQSELGQRRWGFKEWLRSKKGGSGAKVVTVTRLGGLALLIGTILLGVGVVRGLVTRIDGQSALNIWILLAGTIGVQWVILLSGLVTFLLARYWIGGLGWLKEIVASMVRRFAGKVSPEAWRSLIQGKGKQPSALAWRLTRMLQLGGVGFNVGLIAGLFGVLWFTNVNFYWESSLSQFGSESLGKVTRFLAAIWGGGGLTDSQIAGLKDISGKTGDGNWKAFFNFIFAALFLWGLFPRVLLWIMAVLKEHKTLGALEFQDLEHRQLWREISRAERAVTMEGMKDGVVLLDVGGLGLETAEIRPFLLQTLRVNPEKSYAVGVLDTSEEREAWEAIRSAPCGVVMLVEGWSLSPKQMTALAERIRREAGEDTVLRVLVMGDGVKAPHDDDFQIWQEFIDGLRDPRLECVAFEG